MPVHIMVWVGGDVNGRRDGETYTVRPNNQPWTGNERGGNHRVVLVPGGVTKADLQYLEAPHIVGDEIVNRRKHRLSATQTATVKASVDQAITVINQADLENNLRVDA